MSVYNSVPLKRPKRSVFPIIQNVGTSLNIGELIPNFRPFECIPGDTLKISQINTIDLQPLVSPFKGDLYLESWCFFVSLDNLYYTKSSVDSGKFSDILTSTVTPDKALPLPKFGYNYDSKVTAKKTLWDYFGLPVNDYTSIDDEDLVPISQYPFRAYYKIWDEYFRDENLQEIASDGSDIWTIKNVNYKKDRFTSAFTAPQKGNPITLKLTGTGSVVFENYNFDLVAGDNSVYNGIFPKHNIVDTTDTSKSFTKESLQLNYINFGTSQGNNIVERHGTVLESGPQFQADIALADVNTNGTINWLNEHNSFDFSEAGTFTIDDLRLLNKLQKWQERNQLCGSRYKEYLLSNYGIAPNDETLQRPVLIGHIKTPVIVNSVIQNNPSDDSPQSTKSGNGTALQSTYFGKWTCKEHGYIIILSALRPKAAYTQGIHRSFIKDTVYDYFNPIFQSLGQEEIFNAELFFTGDKNDDMEPWGYTDRYNSYRYIEDMVTGDLRDGLDHWQVSRKFENLPSLDSDFIQVKKSEYDYLFADVENIDQAILHSTTMIKAIRPISKYANPSL